MAAEIRERWPGTEVEMIPSGKGRFEVSRDGVAIFEKSKLHRHAEKGEIIRLLEQSS